MTLFAGVLARGDAPLSDRLRRSLVDTLSRDPRDTPMVSGGEHWCCAHVNIGAFPAAGRLEAPDSLSLLAGEPLLKAADEGAFDRDQQVLHDASLTETHSSALRRANGVFALAVIRPSARHVRLIADKLAIRPIYYAVTDDYVAFSTVMRTFAALPLFDRGLDLRALTEVSAFEYPLADRMPQAGIHRIRAAEIIDVGPAHTTRSSYWHWDRIPVTTGSLDDAARQSYEAFIAAVRRRARGTTTARAFLSGGLDSRAVVVALRSAAVHVQTFNFARQGTQDHAFGAAIAERVGTRHHEVAKPVGERTPDYAELMAAAIASSSGDAGARQAHVVWSGEGGSVSLGHVHMHASMVARMQAGDVDGAIEDFLERENIRIPLKMFRPAVARTIAGLAHRGVRDELDELGAAEPARRFHLFLLQNDQRRKLTRFFEGIDLHRLEYQLPFFDSDFLTTILRVPVEACLGHRFYSRWFEQFEPVARAVAWQVYPGHDPCPVEPPHSLAYQWDQQYQRDERRAAGRALMRRTRKLVMASDFPRPLLSRARLAGAAALHAAGIRNYEYVLEAAAVCHQYWQESQRRQAGPIKGSIPPSGRGRSGASGAPLGTPTTIT